MSGCREYPGREHSNTRRLEMNDQAAIRCRTRFMVVSGDANHEFILHDLWTHSGCEEDGDKVDNCEMV
jgi:hypothetical protein